MKYSTIIVISLATYVLLLGGAYFGAKKYVDNKDSRLRREAYDNFDRAFSNQNKYVSIGFSGKKVAYEKTSIPKYDASSLWSTNRDKEKWTEDYGDLYKMYKLIPKYTSQYSWDSDNQWSGWLLKIIEKISYDAFQVYQLYPYEVGYIKQSDSWMYNYMPSVQDAVNEAFDFHTTNEKSSYSKYLSDKSYFDIIRSVENEYYEMYSYDWDVEVLGEHKADSLLRTRGYFTFYKNDLNTDKGHSGYMYNGFYKVFNHKASLYYYQIAYKSWSDPKKRDLTSCLIWLFSIITFLLLCVIIPVIIKSNKQKKEQSESLKDKLIRTCNPQRFMSPYDEKKVAAANDIYEKLMNVSDEDIDSLIRIRKEASESLGISFIDHHIYNELLSKTNPKRFMNPYDPEKVRIANTLYTKLSNGGLDIDEIEEIQKEISEKLYNR